MRHFSKKLGNDFFEDLKLYIASFAEMHSAEHTQTVEDAFNATNSYYEETKAFSVCQTPMASKKSEENPFNIIINEKKPSFCSNLFNIIDEKNIKDSAVYKKADIDRRLFSKMRSDMDYHPAKNTAIRLCLALELDIAETERLLESAGYCLSMSSTSDLVIRYCIEHKTFKIVSVNEALDYFGEKII
ncbi:MAG: hypothetical protein IJR70_02885 [Eubacterium sp.]|nr:hypothetical protein [Eubacterium sp.]